jgi:hypothetical protein
MSRWSLRHLKVEINLLVAKVSMLFSKEESKRPSKARVRAAQKIVRTEYRVLTEEAPRDIRPYVPSPVRVRPSSAPVYQRYPVFGLDQNGYPKNVVAETVVQLTGRARLKAVRDGDIATALAAAVVEQIVVDSVRKAEETQGDKVRWS